MTEQEIIEHLLTYFKEHFPTQINNRKDLYTLECNLLAYIMEIARKICESLLSECGTGYTKRRIEKDGTMYIAKGNDSCSIHSLFGLIEKKHARYVPEDDKEAACRTWYPLDAQIGIEEGHTPACHYFLTLFTGNDVYGESVGRFNEIFRPNGAGRLSLWKAQAMTNSLGLCLEEAKQEKITQVMAGGDIPEEKPVSNMAVFIDATKTPEIVEKINENNEKKRMVQYRDAKIGSVAQIEWNDKKNEVNLKNITHVAAVEKADNFYERVYTEMLRRGKNNTDNPIVFVADGASWIWDRVDSLAENRIEILDYYHASEHLAEAAKIIHGEGTEAFNEIYSRWESMMYQGKIKRVIDELQKTEKKMRGAKRKTIKTGIKYFQTHSQRMKYDEYRKKRFPIGSGTVESACKNVVGCRMKRTGMKWSSAGMTAMLQIRASLKSQQFKDDFEKVMLKAA